MLLFNELRIANSGKHIIVDVSVEDLDYYENVYLDTILIYTKDKYNEGGPGGEPLYVIDCGGVKHYRAFRDIDGTGENLFYVYVTSSGEAGEGAPCSASDSTIVGPVYNKCPIYKQLLSQMKEIDGCIPPDNLLDSFFRYKAFQLALDTGNYTLANAYWDKFFSGNTIRTIPNRCGCHG